MSTGSQFRAAGDGHTTPLDPDQRERAFKAGFRSNNIDPNARHCMASAVAGAMRTFGIDEPVGCYDDIEAADAFVLWGSNMAEMHPIPWTRVTDRRLSAPHVRVAVLSTFEHRSFDLADIGMVFKPQTDPYLLNAIANHIITTGRVNEPAAGRGFERLAPAARMVSLRGRFESPLSGDLPPRKPHAQFHAASG